MVARSVWDFVFAHPAVWQRADLIMADVIKRVDRRVILDVRYARENEERKRFRMPLDAKKPMEGQREERWFSWVEELMDGPVQDSVTDFEFVTPGRS